MTVRTWLRCPRCARETPHDIHYAGRVMCDATCVACGIETKLQDHVLAEYVSDMPGRIRTKPERLARELRGTPLRARTLPLRIASKPARMGHEVIHVIR
jgi:hypothetical protein